MPNHSQPIPKFEKVSGTFFILTRTCKTAGPPKTAAPPKRGHGIGWAVLHEQVMGRTVKQGMYTNYHFVQVGCSLWQ